MIINAEVGKMGYLKYKKETILLIDDIYCKYFLFDTKTPLIITFSPANILLSEEDIDNKKSPWGFDFLKKEKLNVISFSCTNKKNWYRNESLYDFIEKLSIQLLEFKVKVGYGSSMGGFAAASFSNLLDLDRLLLINPISTLKLDLVPFETRFKKYTKILNWESRYNDGADTKAKGYIIYDPLYGLDKKHAERFHPRLIHLKAPGLGHNMPEHLKNLNMLKWIVRSFIDDNLDINIFYQQIRHRRKLRRYYKWMLSDENMHLTDLREYIIKKHAKKNGFYNIGNDERKLNQNDIDTIRDMAVFLEKYDISKALMLMNIVKKFRPRAVYINKKINEYEKLSLLKEKL